MKRKAAQALRNAYLQPMSIYALITIRGNSAVNHSHRVLYDVRTSNEHISAVSIYFIIRGSHNASRHAPSTFQPLKDCNKGSAKKPKLWTANADTGRTVRISAPSRTHIHSTNGKNLRGQSRLSWTTYLGQPSASASARALHIDPV